MKWLKEIWLATWALVAVGMVALSACGADDTVPQNQPTYSRLSDDVRTVQVTLPDGRTVVCLLKDGYREVALSCDWDHAQVAK